jgi:hypothetical protein
MAQLDPVQPGVAVVFQCILVHFPADDRVHAFGSQQFDVLKIG